MSHHTRKHYKYSHHPRTRHCLHAHRPCRIRRRPHIHRLHLHCTRRLHLRRTRRLHLRRTHLETSQIPDRKDARKHFLSWFRSLILHRPPVLPLPHTQRLHTRRLHHRHTRQRLHTRLHLRHTRQRLHTRLHLRRTRQRLRTRLHLRHTRQCLRTRQTHRLHTHPLRLYRLLPSDHILHSLTLLFCRYRVRKLSLPPRSPLGSP